VPLKAVVEGETVIGPDLSDGDWADLKLRHTKGLPVTMSCCGAPGHLRVSRKGTRHFYHAVDTGCNYAEESPEHLEIKYGIYRICRAEGWESIVEFPAPDRTWISDVYAIRDGRNIVFEVQISRISPYELEDRDKKYCDAGIEAYWLLDNFPWQPRNFQSWYDTSLPGADGRPGETIPYIDHSFFETGPENPLFITRGIRSAGLHAKNQTLFTTHNPEIPLAVWVREVLKGNYKSYLEETAAAYHDRRRLILLAAPALIRFRELYHAIVRDQTYRSKVDRWYRIAARDPAAPDGPALQKKARELYAEIDWLETEYRATLADSFGLFTWKQKPGQSAPRPFFRPETALAVQKLQECVQTFSRWEASFARAFRSLEQEFPARKRP
jgi:hypothetical protein